MNSFQESKNELEAAIRYAENAISAAQATIESMQFRQDMAKKEYEERTGREEALQREVAELKAELEQTKSLEDQLKGQVLTATMPVIPRDVAIAIFREGIATGVLSACAELENASDIEISDRECMGNFEVEYTQYVNLSEHLDFDWIRDKAAGYTEDAVIDSLQGLCADNNFECRIHGIDDAD